MNYICFCTAVEGSQNLSCASDRMNWEEQAAEHRRAVKIEDFQNHTVWTQSLTLYLPSLQSLTYPLCLSVLPYKKGEKKQYPIYLFTHWVMSKCYYGSTQLAPLDCCSVGKVPTQQLKALGFNVWLVPYKPDTVAHIHSPSTPELKVRKSDQGHSQLYNKFEASLVCMKPCFKTNKNNLVKKKNSKS